ncbi:MAG: hypothetical protein ACYSTG_00375 [Planctomycetota bacterium]|jgi:hypothetical protein
MAETKANSNESVCNKNAIIIAVTIVVLAVIFMYFRDREQKRNLQLQRLDTQMNVWEEWGPPQQNKQLNNTTGEGGGKIL